MDDLPQHHSGYPWYLLRQRSFQILLLAGVLNNIVALGQRIVPRQHISAGIGLVNGLGLLIGGSLGPVVGSLVLSGKKGNGATIMAGIAVAAAVASYWLGRRARY